MSDFFNRLDLLRKRRGESIIEIARLLSISGPAVHSWKKGGLPKPDKLRLLAEHYGVSVEWLLAGDDRELRKAGTARYPEAPPGAGAALVREPVCRIPEGCDIVAELAQVRRELDEVRERLRQLDVIGGQIATLTGLLGGPLRGAAAASPKRDAPEAEREGKRAG